MIWIVFIGGVVTGALSIGLIILAHEILEIGSDMDCIRRDQERQLAEKLVDRAESEPFWPKSDLGEWMEAREVERQREELERKAQAPWN